MNRSIFICLIIVLIACFASAQQVPTYSNISTYGIELNEGWHYSPKDSTAFANLHYDHSQWEPIDPGKTLANLPQVRTNNIGWLRMRFKVSSSLSQRTLLISPFQNCASEIYLDGKLIRRYGRISENPSELIPIGVNQSPEEIQLTSGEAHVFAVRFVPWSGAVWLKDDGYMFLLTMTDFPTLQKMDREIQAGNETYVVLVSVFLLLSILHLSFYRYDPSQRANLFFAFYTIVSTLAFFLVCLQGYFEDARFYALSRTPAYQAVLMSGVFVIHALGILFGFKIKKLAIAMWTIYAVAALSMLVYGVIIPFYLGLIIFESVQLYLLIKALALRKRGTGIIATGFFISIAMLILTAVEQTGGLHFGIMTGQLIIGVTYLSPAFAISLFLAREFALDSGLLRQKLEQVRELSAKNIAQEQERQRLLASHNENLERQVVSRTSELQLSLDNLHAAQAQLIQSEKLASLGELTAGIAHEIQNPLNFVNNFSDLSVELLEEMQQETASGNLQEAEEIAQDLKQNLKKIAFHGRRAETIVRSMLQHSRTSSGQKEPTDINSLADEFLRLAYHGLRANDKAFNVELVTDFVKNLPKVEAVPQDLGRVMLNVFTNAFYSTREKQRRATDKGFMPKVEVSTLLSEEQIELRVKDNGIGIPQAIKEKIMQPFFTTKPTGEGTGLGLSLSYDIIVKGHGGRIEVESTEGEGALFKIILPISIRNQVETAGQS